MGYYPNAMARGLARNRTNAIGLVFLHQHSPLHTSESFTMFLDGVLSEATYRQRDTLICTSYSWSDGRNNMAALLDRRCDGLILVVPRTDNPVTDMLKEYEIPFVILGGRSDDPSVSFVDTDCIGESRRLVNYLFQLGHKRIALAQGHDYPYLTYATDRLEGYRQAHRDQNMRLNSELIFDLVDPDHNLGTLMQLPPSLRPTAIFGACDANALHAMDQLRRAKIRVPEDISVVGYDDILSAAKATPALTTIKQPLKTMGEQAVKALLDLIDCKVETPQRMFLPTELVVRESATPPNS
jgi:DNA-binding LacI/PurR family transcriptional regulator